MSLPIASPKLQAQRKYKKKQQKKCASLEALERAPAADKGTVASLVTTCTQAESLDVCINGTKAQNGDGAGREFAGAFRVVFRPRRYREY